MLLPNTINSERFNLDTLVKLSSRHTNHVFIKEDNFFEWTSLRDFPLPSYPISDIYEIYQNSLKRNDSRSMITYLEKYLIINFKNGCRQVFGEFLNEYNLLGR